MSTLHFTDEGNGTPLVFIHGYCESLSIWTEFVKPFTKEYRVICLDLPGFGKSPLPENDFTLTEIAKSVWDFLDGINVKTCFLIGHSLGGYVTLEMVHQQADRMEGFCLFHSTAYADDETKKLNRTKVMEFVAKNGTPAFVHTLIPSLFATPNHKGIKSLLEEASQVNPRAVIGYARAMRDRADMTKVYPAFLHPILFFVGMKDSVIPPESITKQATEARDKQIFYLDNVAHMGMLESTTATQSILLDFLRESH